jgi:hypothetical protein
MLIVEWVDGGYYGTGDSLQVKLPESFAYYERSWSLGSTSYPAYYILDGATIQIHSGGGWQISQGNLTANQLLPGNQFHTIYVSVASGSVYGGLALVYKVP